MDTLSIPFGYPSRPCAVCGSVRSHALYRQAFSEMSTGSLLSGYVVVACEDCGFCFATHIPEQAAFDAYYHDMSKYENAQRGGEVSAYDLARFQMLAAFSRRFLPGPETRIFEIGSATGQLLALLKGQGYPNVLGLDPSPACAEVAQRLYGIRLLTGTLSHMPVEANSVDFLILAGVLEHVRDVSAALERLWAMLRPGGLILVGVPDASRYAEGEDAPFQEFSIEHINFFGPPSLTSLMRANGFAPVAVEQSLLTVNYRTTTPVIYSVFRKAASPAQAPLERDGQTEPGLVTYIQKSQSVDKGIREAIEQLVVSRQPVIIWGAGTHTLRLLASSRLAEAQITAFVDSNPCYRGRQLASRPIIDPADLLGHSEPILISSRVFQAEIKHQIQSELRLDNQVICLYPL